MHMFFLLLYYWQIPHTGDNWTFQGVRIITPIPRRKQNKKKEKKMRGKNTEILRVNQEKSRKKECKLRKTMKK